MTNIVTNTYAFGQVEDPNNPAPEPKVLQTPKKYWTAAETQKLVELYPYTPVQDLALVFGRSPFAVANHASRLGLKKTSASRGEAIRVGKTRLQRQVGDARKVARTALDYIREHQVERARDVLLAFLGEE